jgi:ketol-acid reductoisomerase
MSQPNNPAATLPRVAIIGYGSQGRAHALNLRDSGADVIIGLRPGGPTEAKAKADGFTVKSPAEAIREAGLIAVLTPDMVQPQLYREHIEPNIQKGACLLFAHGLNVHYGEITPRDDLDVILVAPKGPGALVRREFEIGRAKAIKTTFKEETETDLFGEQAVLCGGATKLVLAGWETLVEAGYQPEIAYYECLHELKLIVDLLYDGGLTRMHEFISETAQYGDLTRGPRVIDADTKARMKDILTEIQDGTFARQWIAEYKAGNPEYQRLKQADLDHPIEKIGKTLRAEMAWLNAAPKAAAKPQDAAA